MIRKEFCIQCDSCGDPCPESFSHTPALTKKEARRAGWFFLRKFDVSRFIQTPYYQLSTAHLCPSCNKRQVSKGDDACPS